MKPNALYRFLVFLLALAMMTGCAAVRPQMPSDTVITRSADVPSATNDPYSWMERNDSPRVQQWLDGQAERSQAYFAAQPSRAALRSRFQALFSYATVSVPYPFQNRYFTLSRLGGQDLAALYVQDGLNGKPELVFDPNTASADKTVTLASWAPSGDGSLLVYGLSSATNDKVSLHARRVGEAKDLPDVIPDDFYPSFCGWDVGSVGFWYSKHDPAKPMSEAKLYQQLYYHRIGTKWQEDQLVFGSADGLEKEALVGAGLVGSSRFLLVTVYGQDAATGQSWQEAYLRKQDDAKAKFVRVLARNPGINSNVVIVKDDMLLTYTEKDAPKGRLLRRSVKEALEGKNDESVFLAEGRGAISDVTMLGDRLFITTLEDVRSVLREYDSDGRFVRNIDLPALGTIGVPQYAIGGSDLFFSFSSFAVPTTVLRFDLKTNALSVIAKADAGFDASAIETTQVWYPSKDGTRVPMFLIRKKGTKLDGENPTVLYGYGGFGISLTPEYDKRIVPFLEHGGVYAVANLRGGGEFGDEWHKAGTKERKQNVFDDFAAAAKWLVDNRYTRREKLAIMGASNGGLLVTATVTQHPELAKAAVAGVPVTDMLRFHKFFGGLYWIPDYGDPDDAKTREMLLAYSPYHNVHDGTRYPATLITTSDGDDRVHPMHSYKMAARLQAANASDAPILLRVERKAGHAGPGSISKLSGQLADEWSFVFAQLGMKY